jgi:hypothetical protein
MSDYYADAWQEFKSTAHAAEIKAVIAAAAGNIAADNVRSRASKIGGQLGQVDRDKLFDVVNHLLNRRPKNT